LLLIVVGWIFKTGYRLKSNPRRARRSERQNEGDGR
jgi:hypothetical protein